MQGSSLPAVRADMRERFVINVRVPPEAMAELLPPRLRPQVVNGWAIATFCVLDLRNITIAPLPTVAGWASHSCAERWGVLDEDGPAVSVVERLTSSRLGSAVTHLGFSAPHDVVRLDVAKDATTARLTAVDGRGALLDARLRRGGPFASAVFDGVGDFARFLADGVRSYGPSRYPGRLTVLDLHKTDAHYESLTIDAVDGAFVERWRAVGGAVDSALRTVDADYEWRYHGLVPEST